MILSGCSPLSGSVVMNYKKCNTRSSYSASTSVPCLPAKVPSSSIRSSWGPRQLKSLSFGGPAHLHISAASMPLLSGDQGGLSNRKLMLTRRRRSFISPRAASKDVPYSFRNPAAMAERPRWWWRTLACLPYLMPLHEPWMFRETAYRLHPFFENIECFTYRFRLALCSFPSWFTMAYFFATYFGVVKNKEWPQFFRFHVTMGMLLEIVLQVMWTVSNWMPVAVYFPKIGMHYWSAVTFVYLFTVLECLRCALSGMYAHKIPFVCDAAYMQVEDTLY
ncbi:protein TIC 20-I, chloroplastic-like [Cornus florida]|uniref:protein TIC 20-I, chloroplastic-like n=1 Tax=Cornus florida TaxID=4283 RepID=UPI00289D8712|nr:protein TIC 20-I, chloroplastic-like [Cornus florida]XP_059634508.1 protein TIC 20-I, chloroplastic-like [Cornus florida]